MSIQVELDPFSAHLNQQAQLVRGVSEQAFAQARAKLSLTAIAKLNDCCQPCCLEKQSPSYCTMCCH